MLEKIDPTKLFYIDEAGLDKYIYRPYAKAPIGQRVFDKISGRRYDRQSIIAARNHNHKFIAPLIYEGTADTDLILWWVENILLPELPKNSITVWDNATFHTSQKLRNLLESQGHTILFLPPYSPDLNPIEHKWHELKQNLIKLYDHSITFLDNLVNQVYLMSSMNEG